MNSTALVVIPTTGKETLNDAILSVINQDYNDVECLVVIDGPEYLEASTKILENFPSVKSMVLPWNIGRDGWYGHRTYYMSAAILNQDYWFALDQDNWFDSTHVRTMVNACDHQNLAWCHSLRKIYTEDKTYICDDNCESLGKYPAYVGSNVHLVDTSTYCIRREVFVQIAPAWYHGWGGDRVFYNALSTHFTNYACTTNYSVNYRLSGNSNSVNAEFFINGNRIMKNRYPQKYPWQ